MRQLLLALATLVIVTPVVLVAGCQRREARPPAPEASRFRLGIVYGAGGRGDLAFNDMAYAGLARARREFGDRLEIQELEPAAGGENREDLLRRLAGERLDLVLAVGDTFATSITDVARDFPDVRFALVAGIAGDRPNVASLTFKEHEGSFLVGAAAAMKSKTGIVGFIGRAMDSAGTKAEAGYIAGATYARPDIRILRAYAPAAGQPGQQAVERELALAQYRSGADVIYQAPGPVGAGILDAAVTRDRLAVGRDTDQSLTAKQDYQSHILTSMLKRVDVAVYEIVTRTITGWYRSGVHELGLAEGGLDYAVNDYNRKLIADIIPRLEALKQDIATGKIAVPGDRKQLDEFLRTHGQ